MCTTELLAMVWRKSCRFKKLILYIFFIVCEIGGWPESEDF